MSISVQIVITELQGKKSTICLTRHFEAIFPSELDASMCGASGCRLKQEFVFADVYCFNIFMRTGHIVKKKKQNYQSMMDLIVLHNSCVLDQARRIAGAIGNGNE